MTAIYQPQIGDWRYGLFECFDSIGDCLLGLFCPNCYAAYASDAAQESVIASILQCLCYPLGLCYLRPRIRNELGIPGSIFKDVLATCCCPCCTAIQIKREFAD
ncbi:unnamed protein product [Brachionus calyciflorus]|uniref:Uncharacterized protein n=1 Tax=Brachionus calyciflorus TaxID=104777 RepID=A0A813MND9_9BILA|nr:unnamed protein product [Brachionus calyciflorus]